MVDRQRLFEVVAEEFCNRKIDGVILGHLPKIEERAWSGYQNPMQVYIKGEWGAGFVLDFNVVPHYLLPIEIILANVESQFGGKFSTLVKVGVAFNFGEDVPGRP